MATTDLIRHVAEEIAADGPEGSSWERLNGFINGYTTQDSASLPDLTIDDSLRNYIIEALARLPNLSPGRFVAGVKASGSKSKASSSKGKRKQADEDSDDSDDDDDEEAADIAKQAKVTTAREAANKPLEEEDHVEVKAGDENKSVQELQEVYGSDFRLVADAASIRDALGNIENCPVSVRPLLHYVLRKRREGVSFPEICDKFKYNVSLTFFQVKGLVDNDLAVKFKAQKGRGLVSWVVAKRYAHLCPHLIDSSNNAEQDDDEAQDDNDDEAEDEMTHAADDSQLQAMSSEAVNAMLRSGKQGKESVHEDDEEGEADLQEDDIDQGEEDKVADDNGDRGLTTLHGLLAFPAVSTREQQEALMHDRSLVRLRILKLLKSSKNHATIRKDLIYRIGVKQPNSTNRKIFNAHLRQLEKEELIERCLLRRPLLQNKDHTEQCWMATAKGVEEYDALTTSSHLRQIKVMRVKLARQIESSRSKVIVESSFSKQLLEKVEQSGAGGATIEQLNRGFGGNRDRHRDLDHMLSSLKKPVNKYYSDYTIYSALEQSGRMRSQRFWTRRWRPDRLAPQEPRVMASDQLNNWIGVPGEKSFLSLDQWRRRGVTKVEAKSAKKRVRKEEVEEDDVDDLESPAPPKKARTSDVKGRPRKHFTASAQKAAERYQKKKAMREREEEERMGVESLLGETTAPAPVGTARKRKTRPMIETSGSEQAVSTMNGQVHDQSVVQEGHSEQGRMATDATAPMPSIENIDPALIASSENPAPTPADPPKPTRKPYAPRRSINLTLQLKYDTLLDFFSKIQIVEGTHFEHEYRRHTRRIVGPDGDKQQYEMDRKVRNKLFHSLEKAGIIQCKKLAAPHTSRGPQRVVWHTPDIEEERLIAFCRDVSEGTARPLESWSGVGGKVRPVLDRHQIDAPDSFFAGMGLNIDLEAKDLDEFLSNDRIRSVVSRSASVRAQYTGRIPGLGARLQYLHKKIFELIQSDSENSFRLKDRTLDLTWWAREATLGQYLKLAFPFSDGLIMDASQDVNQLKLPIKEIDVKLLKALELDEGGDGLHKTLQPLMEPLGALGLAEPARAEGGEQSKDTTWMYTFAKEGVYTCWNEELSLQQAIEAFNLEDPMQFERYWRQVEQDCVSMQGIEDLDELPMLQANLYDTLRRKSAWFRHYHLLKPQQAFLYRTLGFGVDRSVIGNADLLMRISRASMTPVKVLKKYYDRRFPPDKTKKRTSQAARLSSQDGSKTTTKALASDKPAIEGTTLTARQAKSIRRKALETQKAKLAEFDEVLETCLDALKLEESSRKVFTDGLVNIRKDYGRGEAGLTLKRVGQMFDDVMKLHKQGEQTWNAIVNRRKAAKVSAAKGDDSTGGKRKKKEKEAPKQRKAAMEWTKAKDDLLQDAVVILRCRDRFRNPANPLKNWKALEQIFPDPSPTTLKNRYELLSKAVGEEAYLNQLEAEWDTLWTTYRDTDELEDSDPKSPTEFDLMEHIQFLRRHINKLDVANKVDNETGEPLPLEVERMLGFFDYERPPACESYEAYSAVTRFALAEGSIKERTKALYSRAYTLGSNAIFSSQDEEAEGHRADRQLQKERGIANAIVKIIQCTSDDNYDGDIATQVSLDNSEETAMSNAIRDIVDLKIVRKRAKEDRQVPNRSYIYASDYVNFYQTSTLETMPFWRIAEGYEKIVDEGQDVVFRQSENGNTAAYLSLLSQDQVGVELDLSVVEGIKMNKLFNAKKIQDYMLEIPVHLHLASSSHRKDMIKKCAALLQSQPSPEPVLQWLDEGVDSLPSRVNKVWKQWIASLKGDKQILARRLESIFHDEKAGPSGISKDDLKTVCPSKYLRSLLQAAQGFSPPLIFQFGYEETLLISSRYLRSWTISISKLGTFTFPYKWYDIHGQWLQQEWTQALQLILHAIITRPGITLTQLLAQCRVAMDRMEVLRVIQFACEAGVLRKVLSSNEKVQASDAEWEAKNDSEIALIAV